MALLLALSGWDTGPWAARISAQLPDHDIRCHPETTGNPTEIRYLLAWKPPADLPASLPNLEAIFSLGAGVDHLLGLADLPDVPVVRIVDPDLTMRMTEWVVLQVLLHHRRHRLYAGQQKQRLWRGHAHPAASAVRVGVLGLGVLGADAASALARLGFQVAGWSRTPKQVDGVESFSGDAGLGAFLARTDILVNLLPLTPATTGLLDYGLLARLQTDGNAHPNATRPVLINAGRGGSQIEADILRALDTGVLSGCSLDVFEHEPLPAASPLWSHPAVCVTPHVAAESEPEALSRNVAAQIRAHEAGEGLRNVVDRAAGY